MKDGGIKYWNIFANGVIERYEPDSGNNFYYLKDHLGSTRAVVNSSGTVVEAHDYYPFGLLMPGRDYHSGVRTKELFTGKEKDSETGLDYFGARYYWATGGRWWSVDVSAHKYTAWSPFHYTFNNPVIFFDPTGLEPILVSKWWFILTHHEYLTKGEKEQWYSRLESAKLFYYNMGYIGIAEWIMSNDFYVTIYNYLGMKSHIGGETHRIKNEIFLSNEISQDRINVYYAHELAHLRGYTEVGAYATSAALLGSGGQLYVLNNLIKHISKNPHLLKRLPPNLRKLFQKMLTQKGIDPEKASIFYEGYQQWGKEILREFERPSDSASYADDDNWWWRGWGAQYGSSPR